jgi:hypothetical protein
VLGAGEQFKTLTDKELPEEEKRRKHRAQNTEHRAASRRHWAQREARKEQLILQGKPYFCYLTSVENHPVLTPFPDLINLIFW